MFYLPVHVNPSPVNPGRQMQLKLPSVLLQLAFALQPPLFVAHSSISATIQLNLHKYIAFITIIHCSQFLRRWRCGKKRNAASKTNTSPNKQTRIVLTECKSHNLFQCLYYLWNYQGRHADNVFCHDVYEVIIFTCAGESISSVSW